MDGIYIYMYTIVYIYINGSIMIHRPNFSLLRFRDGKVEIGWTMMESRIFDSMGVSIQHPGKGTTMKTIQLKSAWPTVCQLMLQSPASNPRRSDPVSSASPIPGVHNCGWSPESTENMFGYWLTPAFLLLWFYRIFCFNSSFWLSFCFHQPNRPNHWGW